MPVWLSKVPMVAALRVLETVVQPQDAVLGSERGIAAIGILAGEASHLTQKSAGCTTARR